MIEKNRFQVGMAILAGAFAREVDKAVLRAYYAVLSPKLTTEQFAHAVQRAMESERFWPSPAVLLEKVMGSAEDRSARAWESTYQLAAGDRFRSVTPAQFAALDTATRAGIAAIGGLHVFADASEFELAALQRTFRRAYRDALNAPPVTALPAAPPERRLAAGGEGDPQGTLPGLPPLVHAGPVRDTPRSLARHGGRRS